MLGQNAGIRDIDGASARVGTETNSVQERESGPEARGVRESFAGAKGRPLRRNIPRGSGHRRAQGSPAGSRGRPVRRERAQRGRQAVELLQLVPLQPHLRLHLRSHVPRLDQHQQGLGLGIRSLRRRGPRRHRFPLHGTLSVPQQRPQRKPSSSNSTGLSTIKGKKKRIKIETFLVFKQVLDRKTLSVIKATPATLLISFSLAIRFDNF